jgi:hypothetical protein
MAGLERDLVGGDLAGVLVVDDDAGGGVGADVEDAVRVVGLGWYPALPTLVALHENDGAYVSSRGAGTESGRAAAKAHAVSAMFMLEPLPTVS